MMSKRTSKPPAGRSLLWTFVGAFLVVLIGAALLQGAVIVMVMEPLARRASLDQAAVTARGAANRIEALPRATDDEIATILRGANHDVSPEHLVFRRDDGTIVTARPLPRRVARGLSRLFADVPDSLTRSIRPRRAAGDRDDLGPPPMGALPDSGRSGGGPGFGGPGGGFTFEIASRLPVTRDDGAGGEILIVTPELRLPFPARAATYRALLFLPLAAVLSAIAGTLLFRHLLKRLKKLETLAARVAAGDLEARVEETGPDEIGRLGRQLNVMTENLAQARRDIESADRQRRRLLADISHELGTPLTSIKGYTETILDPSVPVSDEERRGFLRSVLAESERMNLLIQDLLELARLESGAGRLVPERLDWTALCRNTMSRFAPRFEAAGLALAWNGPGTEAWIEADGRRMEQVLDNLLGNALRYVPSGGTVTLSLARSGDRHVLRVADDGPGIPEADRAHVFDRFYRADPARSTGGTGLGLAIVREIVTGHGGRVSVEGNVPRGSVFVVEMPAA